MKGVFTFLCCDVASLSLSWSNSLNSLSFSWIHFVSACLVAIFVSRCSFVAACSSSCTLLNCSDNSPFLAVSRFWIASCSSWRTYNSNLLLGPQATKQIQFKKTETSPEWKNKGAIIERLRQFVANNQFDDQSVASHLIFSFELYLKFTRFLGKLNTCKSNNKSFRLLFGLVEDNMGLKSLFILPINQAVLEI